MCKNCDVCGLIVVLLTQKILEKKTKMTERKMKKVHWAPGIKNNEAKSSTTVQITHADIIEVRIETIISFNQQRMTREIS